MSENPRGQQREVRQAARLVVCDADGRLLLFNIEDEEPLDPLRPDLLRYWVTPGGGLEPRESFLDAAHRELREETGLREVSIGPQLWHRTRELRMNGHVILAEERYFLVRPDQTAISLEGLSDTERKVYRRHHWWTTGELHNTSEIVLPPGLVDAWLRVSSGDLPEESVRLDGPPSV